MIIVGVFSLVYIWLIKIGINNYYTILQGTIGKYHTCYKCTSYNFISISQDAQTDAML